MRTQRAADWDARLAAAIEVAQHRRFVWGQFDCCMWTADVVTLMRGADPAAWFRGRYKSRAGAYAALRAYAGGGIMEAAERIAVEQWFCEVAPELAQRGDVAIVPTARGDALSIVNGEHALAPAFLGLERVQRSQIIRAWAV